VRLAGGLRVSKEGLWLGASRSRFSCICLCGFREMRWLAYDLDWESAAMGCLLGRVGFDGLS